MKVSFLPFGSIPNYSFELEEGRDAPAVQSFGGWLTATGFTRGNHTAIGQGLDAILNVVDLIIIMAARI